MSSKLFSVLEYDFEHFTCLKADTREDDITDVETCKLNSDPKCVIIYGIINMINNNKQRYGL
jgi:hypothetical protein